MALSIEQLRAAFKTEDKTTSRPNNYYPFWDMKTGEQCIIRFLPDQNQDNPHGFVVEKAMHNLTINGEEKKVRCMKPEQDCPICKVSAAYYKDDDKVNGKKFWKKKQHLAQALIVEDPLPANTDSGETHEGKVRFIALGYQLYNIIKESFESGELDELPYAYKNGCDFIIKKTKQGEYASYATGTKFVRKTSNLSKDVIAEAEDQMIDLSTLLPAHLELEKVESMLEAALGGGSYTDTPTASTPASTTEVTSTAPTQVVETDGVPFEADTSTNDDGDTDVDKMLKKIRERQGDKV